jgi:hypothetical protein
MLEYPENELENGNYSGHLLNVGFMRTIPSVMTLTLFENWARNTMDQMGDLEQNCLQIMLRSYKPVVKDSRTLFNLSALGLNHELLRLHYFPGVFVQNGRMMLGLKKKYLEQARSMNVHEPYVCHLAWIRPSDKIPTFTGSGLWFLGTGNDKCGSVPDKRLYADWKVAAHP